VPPTRAQAGELVKSAAPAADVAPVETGAAGPEPAETEPTTTTSPRRLWLLVGGIVAAVAVVTGAVVHWLPASTAEPDTTPTAVYLKASGQTWYVDVGDGERDLWTTDGVTFHSDLSADLDLHRVGTDLLADDGQLLLACIDGCRVLVDPTSGWPMDAEEDYYLSVLGPQQQ
jgi:hypothetical protein